MAALSPTFYDKDGELTDTTDADGRRTTYSYNADGDNTGETWLTSSGGALNVITYSYDADDELTGAADNYADTHHDLRLGRQRDLAVDVRARAPASPACCCRTPTIRITTRPASGTTCRARGSLLMRTTRVSA